MQRKTLELLIKRPALWIVFLGGMVAVSFAMNRGSGGMTMFWPSIGWSVVSAVVWYIANTMRWDSNSVPDTQVPHRREVRAWINMAVPMALTILASSHIGWVRQDVDTVTLRNGVPVTSEPGTIWISPLQDEIVYVPVKSDWSTKVLVRGKMQDGTPVETTLSANFGGTLSGSDYAVRHYRSATGMDVDDVALALDELLIDHCLSALAVTELSYADELVLGRDIVDSIDAAELAALNVKWSSSLRVAGLNVVSADLVQN